MSRTHTPLPRRRRSALRRLWLLGLGAIVALGLLSIAWAGRSGSPRSEASIPQATGDQVIVLDAGHGGADPGCSAWGVEEKSLTLSIVSQTQQLLEQAGYTVRLTRTGDDTLPKEERVPLSEQLEGALFVSVHLNALADDTVTHGIETYYNDAAAPGSLALARAVQTQVVAQTGGKNRGYFGDSDYYVVHHALMPACLVEVGFLTAREEGALLQTAEYQQQVAAGIALGIADYLAQS